MTLTATLDGLLDRTGPPRRLANPQEPLSRPASDTVMA